MYVWRRVCTAEERDRLIAELWERGTAGILEEELPGGGCRLSAFFETPLDMPEGYWEYQPAVDWAEVSRAQWEPVLVGRRLWLAPPWEPGPAPPGRLRLDYVTGRACGTGWHAATQLALEGLERCLRPGDAVLDVGTGSGILSVAAKLLGAGRVVACDTDREAVALAAGLFRERGVRVWLLAGSADAVAAASADLVAANLEWNVLIGLAPEFRRVLKPGGRLVLSGIPRRRLEAVGAAYGNGEVIEKQGWVALLC